MTAPRFGSPFYSARLPNGDPITIDVTNSISAGLEGNSGIIDYLASWMDERGLTRVLDFGAGALRHTLPLLKKGFEVTAVEFAEAFQRERASEQLTLARTFEGFTELIWPADFLKSRGKYDVALLVYVLQTMPVIKERRIVLDAIAKRLDSNGPKRLLYASRSGEARSFTDDRPVFNDGWIMGRGESGRSFYTEWNSTETDKMFAKAGYGRAGNYKGPSQPFIYDFEPGTL